MSVPRIITTCVGLIVIVVGCYDITSRLASRLDAAEPGALAIGPLIAIDMSQNGGDSLLVPFSKVATSSRPIFPIRLMIPSLTVDARVDSVGKKADGTMATPANLVDVGWYSLGSRPGAAGNAVMAGHVNNARGTSGVFENLSNIHIGDKITVSDSTGQTLTYVVFETHVYPTDQAPNADIFSTTGPSQLVLVTCDGKWISSEHAFNKRFVVYARLLSQ